MPLVAFVAVAAGIAEESASFHYLLSEADNNCDSAFGVLDLDSLKNDISLEPL